VSAAVLDRRCAGVVLHPTSLPGPGDCGRLGREALAFAEFLSAAGFGLWQTLPLGPTHDDRSPYLAQSTHAGNPRLIDPEFLVAAGWLDGQDARAHGDRTAAQRSRLWTAARAGFEQRADTVARRDYAAFGQRCAHWLDDYALYVALKAEHGQAAWLHWPAPVRDRAHSALDEARARLAGPIEAVRFEQFVFDRQWRQLRAHASARGVRMFGDLPIFVALDSADVWSRRELFDLGADGQPRTVAGVPPDYFSATGQLWGNPLYRWDRMRADRYRWWIERMATQLERFDLVRVDHFRGFESCWSVPAGAATAAAGHWEPGPGAEIFEAMRSHFGELPLVAEDLGVITPAVDALRTGFGFPGMKILQFAFDGDPGNPYLPHMHDREFVVYTGTHDNDTTLGWFDALDDAGRRRVVEYLGHPREPMPWPLVRCALASVARTAVVPLQDLLGLGAQHRMNVPGTGTGNWEWRFDWSQVDAGLAPRLRDLLALYGRAVA